MVVEFAFCDDPVELYWLKYSVLPSQVGWLESGKNKNNKLVVWGYSHKAKCYEVWW